MTTLSRRGFLQTAVASGAVLTLGFTPRGALAQAAQTQQLTPFLKVAGDGTVTAIVKHLEGGQGAATGLSTLIAEELNMQLTDIRFEMAPANAAVYNNLLFGPVQATGGSTAMANSFMQYRTAGAAAREMLIAAAAQQWSVAPESLALKEGIISGDGKSVSIGELVGDAAKMDVPAEPTLKDPSEWTQIGNPQRARRDSSDKINGQAMFSMDVHLDGMLVVAIKRTPRMGGVVISFDDSAAKDINGFDHAATLPNGAGVAVYARNTWAAFQARDALSVEWDFSKAEARGSDEILADLRMQLDGEPDYNVNNADQAAVAATIDGAATTLSQEFYFPLLAHSPMEPINATIEPLENGGVRYHDGAQGPTANQMVAAQILEISPEQVEVKSLYAGGFFGRRLNGGSDYLVELTMAYALTDRTRPVKLVWSREDDVTGGWYRPMALHRVRVGLDDAGKIIGWEHHVATPSIFKGSPFEEAMVRDGVDSSSIEGIADGPYTIPGMALMLSDAKKATTVNWWRSVGHSHTAYVMEVMMDLAAEASGIDPVEFRLNHLDQNSDDGSRAAQVLKLAAEKAGWAQQGDGRSLGVAVHKSFNTYIAEVCEISTPDDTIRIDKVTAAVDCGIAVNPDVIKAQVEGAIGWGMGHAMRGEITLDKGEIVQSNFPDYEPLRIADIGAIDVHIVPSALPPSGIGEPGTPPAAPALANAIARATGQRITELPMISSTDFYL
ncbi:molybdopterin-dependent oxidoreductase [Paracoccus sp. Z330]|uniref:Molybdopterin-dependent oxidoreductase n=1 Tax=Paracoccus onchidii TaxID=3017813 RepID=A0ABT4ZB55_9RHOB|nr:molybdopterin cofactor-binding domain-containing protein [Paracoccus onchidii]MDB6176372.1 molybdopterin-dependent oxidoreductase [Paracoccus onchidii]